MKKRFIGQKSHQSFRSKLPSPAFWTGMVVHVRFEITHFVKLDMYLCVSFSYTPTPLISVS